MPRRLNHYICKVEDTTNDNEVIQKVYCDVSTDLQAEKIFINHHRITPYVGDLRYHIYFQQNLTLLQDAFVNKK
tara:strand:- start:2182 stop:2403 length:222 start_codon:yes stop_codon:yes gene_type:complete